jgi:hypothetical protein
MNPKIEITEKVLKILNPEYTETDYKLAARSWWQNPRHKDSGGMRLTDLGYNSLNRAGIKDHFVKFYEPILYTNQLVVWLDNFIECPFYLSKKGIHVFNEKMAVQLVLFSGNIAKFSAAKAKSLDKDAK